MFEAMPVDASPASRPRRAACILGTAGHIDHGKSSLVTALTGTDPDRLPEEKARGMTIELGFAHLRVGPDAGDGSAFDRAGMGTGATVTDEVFSVGIVDVPGHERFIRTMVAGATGIDLAMLVVAADDGVMPQTREHVEILRLLGVDAGLIAISKADAVDDDRIAAVREQVAALVGDTPLADWPVVVTSARSGRGLNDVRGTIAALAGRLPGRAAGDVFRLAIDRVFAVHGRGTVVTGSVLCGMAAAQTSLELLPAGLPCKVRELQSFGSAASRVAAGQRAALNLTGIDREQIDRGMELATPGYLAPARYVDARVSLSGTADRPLRSHQRVRVCMGTAETMATLLIIGGRQIEPGGGAWAQLRFGVPVVCAFGQRFILRNETAQHTLGGGRVVRPVSQWLRSAQAGAAESLEQADSPDAGARVDQAVRAAGFGPLSPMRLACLTGLSPGDVSRRLDDLRGGGRLVRVTPGVEVHAAALADMEARAVAFLSRHHAANPAQPGVVRDRFVTWLNKRCGAGTGRAVAQRLEQAGRIVVRGPYVAERTFQAALSLEDGALLEKLISQIAAAGLDPPNWPALPGMAGVSKARSQTLEQAARCDARLVAIGPQRYVAVEAMSRLQAAVRRLGDGGRRFTLAQVRDALGVSRRVVQPLLEHLDRVGFTRRVGDERVLLEAGR